MLKMPPPGEANIAVVSYIQLFSMLFTQATVPWPVTEIST
jgi:hypothetical protein